MAAIYYNTTTGQAYVWNGTSWDPFWAPQRAATAHLTYLVATAGQTVIDLSTMDLNGDNFTLNPDEPEGVGVHVNGIQLVQTLDSGIGDYTVDVPTSTITLSRPLRVEDVVNVELLVPINQLRPGAVAVWALNDPIPNGTNKVFALGVKNPNSGNLVNVQRSEELLVSVDGVIQQPGVGYQASSSTITFSEAPAADSKCWITWFQAVAAPAATATGARRL